MAIVKRLFFFFFQGLRFFFCSFCTGTDKGVSSRYICTYIYTLFSAFRGFSIQEKKNKKKTSIMLHIKKKIKKIECLMRESLFVFSWMGWGVVDLFVFFFFLAAPRYRFGLVRAYLPCACAFHFFFIIFTVSVSLSVTLPPSSLCLFRLGITVNICSCKSALAHVLLRSHSSAGYVGGSSSSSYWPHHFLLSAHHFHSLSLTPSTLTHTVTRSKAEYQDQQIDKKKQGRNSKKKSKKYIGRKTSRWCGEFQQGVVFQHFFRNLKLELEKKWKKFLVGFGFNVCFAFRFFIIIGFFFISLVTLSVCIFLFFFFVLH